VDDIAASVVTCPNCGTRNRLRPRSEGVPRCSKCHQLLPWLVDARRDDFDAELDASVPVLIDLWAPWCRPCKMIEPALHDIARTTAGRIKVVRVNVDEEPDIAGRFQVRGIPLLVLTRNGQEVDRLAGAAPKAQLQAWLEGQLGAQARAGA
jgi:thioredoxin 2